MQHFEEGTVREDNANLCAALTGMRKALDSKCLERDHLFGNKKSTSSLCPNVRGGTIFPDD